MDYFSLLGQLRRPWLDEQSLKNRFAQLSTQAHPDRVHGGGPVEIAQACQRFAELNAAYNCLREPKERLLHLLELESGSRPKDVGQIPSDVMTLFMEASHLLRSADAFLQTRAKTTSPLLKARMFQEGADLAAQLQAFGQRINALREPLMAELKEMNCVWELAPPPDSPARLAALPLSRLEEIYRRLSFFARWTSQVQERSLQISFQ